MLYIGMGAATYIVVPRSRSWPGATSTSDYCSGWLRSFRIVNGAVASAQEWPVPKLASVTSFGEDSAGELYITVAGGTIYRLARR